MHRELITRQGAKVLKMNPGTVGFSTENDFSNCSQASLSQVGEVEVSSSLDVCSLFDL